MIDRKLLARLSVFGLFLAVLTSGNALAAQVRFATYPDVSSSNVVFVYRDSIWIAPIAGGHARLLSDIGERPRNPKFSPDGQWIAYAATVDDNQDIYVAALNGGAIRRVTNHPSRDDMVDWHPDGESLLFKSTLASPRAIYNRLFKVGASGGLPEALPLPYVETAAISDDGNRLLFTYLKDFQEEVWKRYLGGRAPDIWSYDIESGDTTQLTDNAAPDSVPMLYGDNIYYLSERGSSRRSNIWRMGSDGGEATQITNLTDADIRNPSVGDGGIVFEVDGEIFLRNSDASEASRLNIEIGIARDELTSKLVQLGERVESASIGNDSAIVIEARGDVLFYDTKEKSAFNISNTSNAAERSPSLSPDGASVAYQSDVDGEYQLYVRNISTGKTQKLTNFDVGFRYRPFWSPDGRRLAFMDHQQIIWVVDTKDGSIEQVDQGRWRYHWDMPQFRISWSPDSQWLTYSRAGENRNQSIYAYNVRDRKLEKLTSGFYSDFDPVFDPTGNYIAAVSYRSFNPTHGDIDSTFTYKDSMVVSLIPLVADIGVPGDIDWQAPEERESVSIELDGLESRLRVLPFSPGRYSAISISEKGISVVRSADDKMEFMRLDLSKDEPETIWSGGRVQILDASAGSALVRSRDGKLQLLGQGEDGAVELDASKLTAEINPKQEFLQMFDDSWRYQRDFYYDPGMHGVDWLAVKNHYRPLAAEAHSEQELTAIIREMHGELAAGHVYVSVEPPYNRRDATNVGLLGVDFVVRDGAFAIGRILTPGARRSEITSPLDNSTLGVDEGDFVLAVNGRPLSIDRGPWAPFHGLVDQVVNLKIADTAGGKNARTIRVKTLASERKLRELVWVEETRRKVDAASDGKIGYIYVPNTGSEGQNELVQMYRAQYHKQALLIDERFNTGGALGDRLVELLNRPPLNYFSSRNANDYPLPEYSHRGPKALLINSWSYSGGDGFPFLFKTAGIGPLIGTRTWGGLIGPGMRMSLINGGFISAPPQRVYDINGQWAEGNEGVKPNIPLRNDPGVLARGGDQQLDHAVQLLLEEIERVPPIVVPEYPTTTPLPGAGE